TECLRSAKRFSSSGRAGSGTVRALMATTDMAVPFQRRLRWSASPDTRERASREGLRCSGRVCRPCCVERALDVNVGLISEPTVPTRMPPEESSSLHAQSHVSETASCPETDRTGSGRCEPRIDEELAGFESWRG